MHPFFAAPRPLVFAHRGGSALAPENTMAAFDRGIALGVDGLELDVHLSRDDQVVVHHDKTLDRTTNLSGEIARFTADQLARADAAFWFGRDQGWPFRGQSIGVPTLASVLERHRACRVIVELKANTEELAEAVVRGVRAAGAEDRVCVGSFGLRAVRAVRRLARELATSAAREEVRWALYRSKWRWPISRAYYGGYQVPEAAGRTRVVSPRFVADAHRANLKVQVWTVDTQADALRLLGWGIDGLITDRPDVIVPLVGRLSD